MDSVAHLSSFKVQDKIVISSEDFVDGPISGNVTHVGEEDGIFTVEGLFAHKDDEGVPYLATFYVSIDPTEGPELVFTSDFRADEDSWDTSEPIWPVTIEIRE